MKPYKPSYVVKVLKPYEALKGLTRNNHEVTKESIQEFINLLNVSKEVKAELLQISPQNYTGV